MSDVTGSDARQYTHCCLHFYRRTIAYNTPQVGTAATIKIGTIPAGDDHTVYFNAADTWAASGDAAAVISGTVTLIWSFVA